MQPPEKVILSKRDKENPEIYQILDGERWAQWQYSPEEWQREAEDLYRIEQNMPKPKLNGMIGLLLGAVMAAVALFVIQDTQARTILLVVAAGVTLLFLASERLLPLYYRRRIHARHQQRLQIRSPRLFIGANGMYHEAKGYTSLQNLVSADYIGSKNPLLIFTVHMHSGGRGAAFDIPLAVTIPAGREQEAEALVQRFRERYKV